MPIEVKLFDDLEDVARDARGALDRHAQVSPYDRIGWFHLTRMHVLPDGKLLVARADNGMGGRAWLFLHQRGERHAEAFGSWYTPAFSPVFSGAPGAARAELLAAVARRLRTRLDTIMLAPVGDEDGARTALLDAFGSAGWWTRQTAVTTNWIVMIGGRSFDDYWARRPSRLRNTVRRKSSASPLAISILNRFDDAAWARYEAVYRASWKPAEGSPAFLRAMAAQASDDGTLRLGVAEQGGLPVAAQFWTVDGGMATIHKLAHAESARESSPGTLLTQAMFRHVIDEDRPHSIDFGTGDDPYKADWMEHKRPLHRLEFHNRGTPRGWAAAARAFASALVHRNGRD